MEQFRVFSDISKDTNTNTLYKGLEIWVNMKEIVGGEGLLKFEWQT